jgi:hypothetical protein
LHPFSAFFAPLPGVLISPREIHLIDETISPQRTADILDDLRRSCLRVRRGGDVGRDEHIRIAPERMTVRKWLLPENIERRTADLAACQGPDKIFLYEVTPSADIDELAASWHCFKQAAVEDIFSFCCERQEIHQDVAPGNHIEQSIAAAEALDAFHGFLGSAPSGNSESQRDAITSNRSAELSESEDADAR